MAIAFFDLDRTLIARNSGNLWVRAELRGGHISWGEALRGYGWLLQYALGASDMSDTYRRATQLLAGRLETEVQERTARFYRREIRTLYRPGARRALEDHRKLADELVLLTSSSVYLSELVQQELGLDAILCNRFEVNAQGRYTGTVVEPLCYGEGKRLLAERYANARNVPVERCTFYTDSTSDLPVMEIVGRPVAVNPDRRLRRTSAARGWEVVDWGEPDW